MFWSDLVLTYNAYEKGILPETGGLGSQPLKFLPMMALLNSRSNQEVQDEQARQSDKGQSGKQSLTEQYLESQAQYEDQQATDPLALSDPRHQPPVPQIPKRGNPVQKGISPDGYAAVRGLVKPRAGIGRT